MYIIFVGILGLVMGTVIYLKINAVFNTVVSMSRAFGISIKKKKFNKRALEKRLLKLQRSFNFWIDKEEIIIWR